MLIRLAAALLALLCAAPVAHAACSVSNPPPFSTEPSLATMTSDLAKITGGCVDGTPIGENEPSVGHFTNLTVGGVDIVSAIGAVSDFNFTAGANVGMARTTPAWDYNAGGAAVEFAANTPSVPTFDPSRPSIARGMAVFGASINLFLNSAAPATQTIALTPGTYTLQAEGAGHVYTAFKGVPDAANTGNGTSTVVTPLVDAQPGVYIATATAADTFEVRDPSNNVVGTATARPAASPQALAPNFATQIMFAITSGATPFVAGDKFYFEIGAGGAAGPRMPHTFTVTRAQSVEFRVRGTPSRVWLAASPIETPYAASAGTAGSRGADVAVTQLSGWGDTGAATVAFRVESLSASAGDRTIVQLDTGTADNRVTLRLDSATAKPVADIVVGGVLRASIPTAVIYPRTAYSLAVSWNATSATAALNGTVYGAGTALAVPVPAMTTLRFGTGLAGASPLNGYLLRVTVQPLPIGAANLASGTARRSVVSPIADHGCAWDGSTDDADCLNAAFADAGINALPLVWPCDTGMFNQPLTAPEGLVTFADASCGSRPVLMVGPGIDAVTNPITITAGTGGKFWWSGVTIDGSAGTYAPPYLSDPVTLAAIADPATDKRRNPDYIRNKHMFDGNALNNPVWYDWGARDFESFGLFIYGSTSPMVGRATLERMGYDNYSSGSILIGQFGSVRPVFDVIAGNPCKIMLTQLETPLVAGGQMKLGGFDDSGVAIPAGTYTISDISGESVHQPVLTFNYDCSAAGAFTFTGHAYAATTVYVPTTNPLITGITASDMVRGNMQVAAQGGSFVYSTTDGGHEAFGFAISGIDYLQAFTASRDIEVGDIVASGVAETAYSADTSFISNYSTNSGEGCNANVGAWNALYRGNYCSRAGTATAYEYGPFGERYNSVTIGTGNDTATTFTALLNPIPPSRGLVVVAGSARARDTTGGGALTGTGISTGSIDYVTGAVTVTFSSPVASGVSVLAYYQGLNYLGANAPPIAGTPLPLYRRAPYLLQTGPGYPSSFVLDSNTLVDDRNPASTNYAFVLLRASVAGLMGAVTATNNDLTGLNVQTLSFLPVAEYGSGATPASLTVADNLLPTITPPPPAPAADMDLDFTASLPAEVTYTRAGSVYAIGADGKTPALFTANNPPLPAYDQFSIARGMGCYPAGGGMMQRVVSALTPATQTISLPAGPYVAAALGDGEFVISGAVSATVRSGENFAFTLASTQNVTVTPSGALTYMSIQQGFVRTNPKTQAVAVNEADAEITGTTYSTKGAVYLEVTPIDISTDDDVTRTYWLIDDGTPLNQVWLFLHGNDRRMTFRITEGGLTSPVNLQTPYPEAGVTIKIFASWDTTTGEANFVVNGRQIGTTTGISAWPVGLAKEWACNPTTRSSSSNHDVARIKRWWTTLPTILQGEFMTQ